MKIQFDNVKTPHSAAPTRLILTSVGIAYQKDVWTKKEMQLLVDLGADTAESIKCRALIAAKKIWGPDYAQTNPVVGIFFLGFDEETFNRVVKEWEES